MIVELLETARRLDRALARRVGRPYHALLGVGLAIEIAGRLREAPALSGSGGIARLAFELVLFVALLLHQAGELAEHVTRRRD